MPRPAWCGHLKFRTAPLLIVIAVGWLIALPNTFSWRRRTGRSPGAPGGASGREDRPCAPAGR